MDTRMPSGVLLREEFESVKAMFDRLGELSAKGGKVERMHIPKALAPTHHRYEPVRASGKYAPHQGAREIERRRKRMANGEA